MPFYFKPASLGVYMIQDRSGGLISVGSGAAVTPAATPGPSASWAAVRSRSGSFSLRSSANGRWLTVERPYGAVDTAVGPGSGDRLTLLPRSGCRPFPEAGLNAVGPVRSGVNPDGTVFGYADPHLHITADYRAGGLVLSGESFDPFGVTVA
ncbi:MAG: hypothetical protein QOJ25_857, partial [Solirubrobacteraceae bacterium]|nr:hypothetical protein [Solirubrobacteraceae bacterium]